MTLIELCSKLTHLIVMDESVDLKAYPQAQYLSTCMTETCATVSCWEEKAYLLGSIGAPLLGNEDINR
ncbi:hypothetical protein [Xenorhabdus koppenhoeferi]|uniref:hypothetical protein n=1 Tax=Xenorhabdus koppenhoeferi TaxID=351659 RepID=UPI0015A5D2BF